MKKYFLSAQNKNYMETINIILTVKKETKNLKK